MPYNYAADSFYIKQLCSRLSSSEVRFYSENGRFAFLSNNNNNNNNNQDNVYGAVIMT